MATEEIGTRLAYKYRLYPNKEQEHLLNSNIGCARFVYNHYRKARQDAYEKTCKILKRPVLAEGEDPNAEKPRFAKDKNGKTIYEEYVNEGYDPNAKSMSMFDTSKDLTQLKKAIVDEDGHAWLNDADATALIYALRHLDAAYQNFFRGIKHGENIGYPRFKKRDDSTQSYTAGNPVLIGFDEDGNQIKCDDFTLPMEEEGIDWKYLRLAKVGNVKIKVHRIPKGKFVNATISRNSAGHWYVSINVKEVILPKVPKATGEIGITYGISQWITTSDGEVIDLPTQIKKLKKKLARAQKDLARKVPGSNRYYKQKKKVARINEQIANVRSDATHKATRYFVDNYEVIGSRQMESKKMLEKENSATANLPKKVKTYLNEQIANGNFAEINRQLAYKAEWANRLYVAVPSDTPTAQVCSTCGHKQTILASDLRNEWTCEECHTVHSRKYNGAVNVLEATHDILAETEDAFVTKAKKKDTNKAETERE